MSEACKYCGATEGVFKHHLDFGSGKTTVINVCADWIECNTRQASQMARPSPWVSIHTDALEALRRRTDGVMSNEELRTAIRETAEAIRGQGYAPQALYDHLKELQSVEKERAAREVAL